MRSGFSNWSVRKLAAPAIIVFVSALVSLPMGEVIVRLALDEIDYLTPTLIPHEHLIHAIEPGSGGHDSLGFRNRRVPESTEILTIGDSQTYGLSATSKDSWPAQLGQIMTTDVYNMGIGGYGPIDYLYLFDNYINILNPRIVIIAFYFGNDLHDAYFAVSESSSKEEDWNSKSSENRHPLRHWLSQNSLLYQAVKVNMATITNAIRRQEAANSDNDQYVPLHHRGETYVLQPDIRQPFLDLTKEKNRIGLKVTMDVISRVGMKCAARRLECYFLLIPTKGSVYQDIARAGLKGETLRKVENLVKSEELVRSAINNHLKLLGLPAIDPLNAMRKAARESALYPSVGGHPNGKGYKIIAETVASRIQ